jgi:hypothetical protein
MSLKNPNWKKAFNEVEKSRGIGLLDVCVNYLEANLSLENGLDVMCQI